MANKIVAEGNKLLAWTRDFVLETLLANAFTYTPVLVSAVTGYLGYVQGIPWAYLIAAVAVAFGGFSLGLVGFSQWRELSNVRHRLQFRDVKIGKDIHDLGISLMPRFINLASFPIIMEVCEFRASLDKRIPESDGIEHPIIVVPPYATGYFSSAKIYEHEELKNASVDGTIEAVINYGKEGSLKYQMKINKQVSVRFDENGDALAVTVVEKRKGAQAI